MPLLREQDQFPSEVILRGFASQLPRLPPVMVESSRFHSICVLTPLSPCSSTHFCICSAPT